MAQIPWVQQPQEAPVFGHHADAGVENPARAPQLLAGPSGLVRSTGIVPPWSWRDQQHGTHDGTGRDGKRKMVTPPGPGAGEAEKFDGAGMSVDPDTDPDTDRSTRRRASSQIGMVVGGGRTRQVRVNVQTPWSQEGP